MNTPYDQRPELTPKILPGEDAEGLPRFEGFEFLGGSVVAGMNEPELTARQWACLNLGIMGLSDEYIVDRLGAAPRAVGADFVELHIRTGIDSCRNQRSALLVGAVAAGYLVVRQGDPTQFRTTDDKLQFLLGLSQGMTSVEAAADLDWSDNKTRHVARIIARDTGLYGKEANVLGAIVTGHIPLITLGSEEAGSATA